MNVSSVSSNNAIWAEYLERMRNKQQHSQASSELSGKNVLDVKQMLAELKSLEDDPETLKAKAEEMAVKIAEEAKNVSGRHASILKELAADLETVANTGDLSVITEKTAQVKSMPSGMAPEGMSGSSGIAAKRIEALLSSNEDEDEEEESNSVSMAASLVLQGYSDSKIKEQTGISQQELDRIKESLKGESKENTLQQLSKAMLLYANDNMANYFSTLMQIQIQPSTA